MGDIIIFKNVICKIIVIHELIFAYNVIYVTEKGLSIISKYEIDVFNLRQIIGNWVTYREICANQNWKVYDKGNSKEAQLKALRKFTDIEELKQSGKATLYKLTLKNGIDLDLLVDIMINSNKLKHMISKAILEQLYYRLRSDATIKYNSYWYITNNRLAQDLGLITESYAEVKRNVIGFADKYDLPLEQVDDCIRLNSRFIKENIKKALNVLQNEFHVITWFDSYILICDLMTIEHDVLTGELSGDLKRNVPLYPSIETTLWINNTAIPRALREIGLTKVSQLNEYSGYSFSNFYKNVLPKWIREHCQDNDICGNPLYSTEVRKLCDVKRVYCSYCITFDTTVIEDTYNSHCWVMTDNEQQTLNEFFKATELLEQFFSNSITKQVKVKVCDSLEDNLLARYDSYLKKGGAYTFRGEDSYITTGKKVIDVMHDTGGYKCKDKRDSIPQQTSEKVAIDKIVPH